MSPRGGNVTPSEGSTGSRKRRAKTTKRDQSWGAPPQSRLPILGADGAPTSNASSKSGMSQSDTSYFKSNFDVNGFERRPGGGSSKGWATSSVASSMDDPSSNFSRALLKVGVPTPVGSTPGRYSIRIRRASLRQPLGVTFFANEANQITIRDELPHLGLRRGDQLIQVNGEKPQTVDKCRSMLAKSTNVLLTLQHREIEGAGTLEDAERELTVEAGSDLATPRPQHGQTAPATEASQVPDPNGAKAGNDQDVALASFFCRPQCIEGPGASNDEALVDIAPLSRPPGDVPVPESLQADAQRRTAVDESLRTLLSASPPVVTDSSKGEFTVEISRSSQKQRFGVSFVNKPRSTREGESPDTYGLCIADDMPHIGLRMGDHVLSMNGIPTASVAKCRVELEHAMVLKLCLRRTVAALTVPTFLEPIDEVDGRTAAGGNGSTETVMEAVDQPRPIASGLRPIGVPEMTAGAKKSMKTLKVSTVSESAALSLWRWLIDAPLCCSPMEEPPAEFREVPFVEHHAGGNVD